MDFVFLICTERSGSNFIVSLLNGHPEISGPPSSHLFRLFGLNCHNYYPSDNEENWANVVSDFVSARQNMLSHWDTNIDADEIFENCPKRTLREALDYTYMKERRAGERFTVVKENYTYLVIPFLLANWPHCRFIYQVRDPRDVAASWIKLSAISGGIERACENWVNDQTQSLKYFRQIQSNNRTLLVRYEDLTSKPDIIAKSMCRHIGVDYNPDMLEFHKDARTKRNAQRIDAWSNIAKPVIKDNFGKYKTSLSQTDIRYIEIKCGELMKNFGYTLDTDITNLTPKAKEIELDTLRSKLTPTVPASILSAEEQNIRAARLALIDNVKSRVPAP